MDYDRLIEKQMEELIRDKLKLNRIKMNSSSIDSIAKSLNKKIEKENRCYEKSRY